MLEFNTEENMDHVYISDHGGIFCNNNCTSWKQWSGQKPAYRVTLQSSSATLIFASDYSNTRKGFKFLLLTIDPNESKYIQMIIGTVHVNWNQSEQIHD